MKNRHNNIVLTGFRATGKSTVGKIVAEQLGYTFLDTDIELTRQLGASIADIVTLHGWPFFVNLRRNCCTDCAPNLIRLSPPVEAQLNIGGSGRCFAR
jgi:shikimate kinase